MHHPPIVLESLVVVVEGWRSHKLVILSFGSPRGEAQMLRGLLRRRKRKRKRKTPWCLIFGQARS